MKLLSALALASTLLLAGCEDNTSSPTMMLPAMPTDLRICLTKAGVIMVPDRDLTMGEIERLWKNDRLRLVVLSHCGTRIATWYDDLRKRWR